MCFFKKKRKVTITNNKYKLFEAVKFKRRGEVDPGVIYNIKLNSDGEVIYDVQIGGECPVVIRDVPEKDIFPRK
jgi:hypothetical protein